MLELIPARRTSIWA